MIRPDPPGLLDLLSGVLLFFTTSALPASVAQGHAAFLTYKGLGTTVKPVPLLGMPIFVLGGAADIMSAAILFTGTPPVLASYKTWIAGALFLKGVYSLMAMM